ncbi:MAG: tRNA (guanosine(46)-N7)-methyltransferase TrmB [Pyrinomonadaceae bacterium]
MSRVRIHQHVNPLAPFYQFTPQAIEIRKVFARPQMPLHLDIGSARGRFLLKMAAIKQDWNFLGIEIREPLVEEANKIRDENNLNNLHFEFCNATFALDKLLENFPVDILRTITIQFPDPWYKKKHAKRRMVKDNLVETIVRHIILNGKIFIQTDVDFLAEEMFATFRANKNLREIEVDENPFPVKTEREAAVEEKGLPIFRRIFEKVEEKNKVRSS